MNQRLDKNISRYHESEGAHTAQCTAYAAVCDSSNYIRLLKNSDAIDFEANQLNYIFCKISDNFVAANSNPTIQRIARFISHLQFYFCPCLQIAGEVEFSEKFESIYL